MKKNQLKQSNRYINDLLRMDYQQGQVKSARSGLLPFVIGLLQLVLFHLFALKIGLYRGLAFDALCDTAMTQSS